MNKLNKQQKELKQDIIDFAIGLGYSFTNDEVKNGMFFHLEGYFMYCFYVRPKTNGNVDYDYDTYNAGYKDTEQENKNKGVEILKKHMQDVKYKIDNDKEV